jgi:hypothetical protein
MRTEAEYCREQAERMHALAKHCIDLEVRDQVGAMAEGWTRRAKAQDAAAAATVERRQAS